MRWSRALLKCWQASMAESREYAVVRECAGGRCIALVHPAATEGQRVGVVIVVGGPQYRAGSHRQFVLTARALAAAGFPVLRFDYRGMGDSDGEQRTFESVHEDIRTAIDTLTQECGVSQVVLYGLCDAASAVLMYCLDDPRVAGLIVLNPWVRTVQGEASAQLWHYYPRRILQRSFWEKLFKGKLPVVGALSGLFGTVKRSQAAPAAASTPRESFIDRMLQGCANFRGRVLLMISGRDLTAAEFEDLCKRSQRWSKATQRTGVEIERLVAADHTFSTRSDLERANALCVEWLRRG
jgi:exosortase A-associated hydrolase 1